MSGALKLRSSKLLQVLGCLLVALTLLGAVLTSRAEAIGTGVGASGNEVISAIVPQSPFSPGPFDSGQKIDVSIPANSVLTPGATIFLLECAAPNGVFPVSTTSCDGNTGYAGGTITVESNGSVDLINDTPLGNLYPIYALPDKPKLGENSSAGATCGLGASNECVLYIGQGGGSDTGMAQPHFFSAPFQVRSDATDSGTINPGDGSAAVTGSVSGANSTISPGAQTVTADGSDPGLVTVTLNDTNDTPVAGKTVSLVGTSGSSTVTPASVGSDVTDQNGQATFKVTDPSEETVTYDASDTTDSVAVSATTSVTFAAATVNQAVSSVVANPTSVPVLGDLSTITVTLRDHSVNGQPAPLAHRAVSLTASGGISQITPASSGSNVTNAQGQATFAVTDSVNESVIYTAKDTTDATTLTNTASVLFGAPLSVSASKSTVVASPSPALTTGSTTVTVTLLASDGVTPESAKSVTLAANSTSGSAQIAGTNPQMTDGAGQATFTVSDTTAESVTMVATDSTDGLVVVQQPVVAFQLQTAPTLSPSASTVVVSGSPQSADGLSEAIVTVTAVNTASAPVAGATVTVSGSPNSTVSIQPVLGGSGVAPGVTNAQGQAQFGVRDTIAETITLAATVSGVTLTSQPTAVFVAGSADANASTVAASPLQVAADGSTASTVTVTLTDYFGNTIAGKTISLTADTGSSVITPAQVSAGVLPGTTNAAGIAQFKVTDSSTEVVTYTATDTSDGLALSKLVSVTFGTPPPVLPTMNDSTVVTNLANAPADGKSPATITVELRDANGDPVTGKSVTLNASTSTAVVTAAPAPTAAIARGASTRNKVISDTSTPISVSTDSNGNAIFDVTDTTVESVTLAAADTTDSLTGWTVSVSFTTPATTSTTTTSSTSTTSTTSTVPSASTVNASSSGTSSLGGSAGNDSSGATGSSAPGLAFTGSPSALPWMLGLGVVLLLVGTVGRQLLTVRRRTR